MCARVGSLWVITGVARIGLGGRFVGLEWPSLAFVGLQWLSSKIEVFYSWVAGRGTPHFWRITNKFLHEKVAKLASIRVREFSVFLAIFRNAQYQIMRIALYPTVFWRTDASGELASYTNRFFIDFLCFWAWGSSGEPLG